MTKRSHPRVFPGNADGAGNDVLDLLQFAVKRIMTLDDLLAEIVKHLAFASEAELFFAALDEEGFELAFERADLLTDGRLRNSVDLGGFGETFSLS